MAKLTNDQRTALRAKLQNRQGTMAEIGREFGVSRAYVRATAIKLGLDWYSQSNRAARSPSVASKAARTTRAEERTRKFQALADAWKSGLSCEEIAKRLGYPTQIYVASLVARLRKHYGPNAFPYRRQNRDKTA